MKILNVAEKPSVAKNVSLILSNGSARSRPGFSPYNHCFEFTYDLPVLGQCDMVFTSVSGHLLAVEYQPAIPWEESTIESLFTAPIAKVINGGRASAPHPGQQQQQGQRPQRQQRGGQQQSAGGENTQELIQRTLQREARNAQKLILWLDCDREGENIAFEVLDVCQRANPRLANPAQQADGSRADLNRHNVLRAQFSALIPSDIHRAMRELRLPNIAWSHAVDARQELDIRLGAVFTRFQTLHFRKKFGMEEMVSWGPCQFPTLGFVVDRYLRRQSFVSQDFWYLSLSHRPATDGNAAASSSATVNWSWDRGRLYDRHACLLIYDILLDNPVAQIVYVEAKLSRKWRPKPLSTVSMQQKASSLLRINSHQAMQHAESLYMKGLISYPRTETDNFKEGTDLFALIQIQTQNPEGNARIANHANRLLDQQTRLFRWPNAGGHDDNAHPPIHPTKYDAALLQSCSNDEQRLYQYIVKHFLACCSEDAIGLNTSVRAVMRNTDFGVTESFHANGLMVKARNYLDVYEYDRWSDNQLPMFERGDTFPATELLMKQGSTAAPGLLSEADLIRTMDHNGIGTDATIATHIKTIQDRDYVRAVNNVFEPTPLGVALVQGYDRMNIAMSKPQLRAHEEQLFKEVSEGRRQRQQVVDEVITEMRTVYQHAVEEVATLDEEIGKVLPARAAGENGGGISTEDIAAAPVETARVSRCQCGQTMQLKAVPRGKVTLRYLYCTACQVAHKVPNKGKLTAQPSVTCPICSYQVVQVTNTSTQAQYSLCPHCYSHLPAQFSVESAAEPLASNATPCFKCTNPACELATGTSDVSVRSCGLCPTGDMRLQCRASKQVAGQKNYYLQCRVCSASMGLWSVQTAAVAESSCSNGCKLSDHQTPARQLTIHFSPGQLPASFPASLTMCVAGCDSENVMQMLGWRLKPPSDGAQRATDTSAAATRSSSNASVMRSTANQPSRSYAANGDDNELMYQPAVTRSRRLPLVESPHRSVNSGTNVCYKCGQPGHYANSCSQMEGGVRPVNNSRATANAGGGSTCYKCGQPGHYAANCPQ